MVKPQRVLGAVLALAATTPAAAQTGVDWRPSGGGLFAGVGPDAISSEAQGAGAVRLSDLDQPFADAVAQAADRHGLDRKLLHAVVTVESAYRDRVCSPAGACGLTQLMPGTAADLGVRDRFDPDENLRGGADYLARQILRFGDLRLALAAYNAGPDRVARLGRIPNIAETQAYVVAVIDCYLTLTAGREVRASRDCAPAEAGL
jgi:soluble lytic murein transglycosylase-like protein